MSMEPSGTLAAKAVACCAFVLASTCSAATFSLVTSNYPPYSFTEGGVQKGMALDVLKEAFARMNIELKIEDVPFPRAIQMFQRGEADGIFPFSVKPERMAYTLYPKEYLVADANALFVRADSSITFSGKLSQLGTYSFGKQRSAFNGQLFSDAVAAGQISKVEEVRDLRQVVKMLVASRFDIAVGPRLVMRYYAQETGNAEHIKELKPALGDPLPAYIGFSKKKDLAALSDRFDQTLAKMRKDGSYQRIIEAYLN